MCSLTPLGITALTSGLIAVTMVKLVAPPAKIFSRGVTVEGGTQRKMVYRYNKLIASNTYNNREDHTSKLHTCETVNTQLVFWRTLDLVMASKEKKSSKRKAEELDKAELFDGSVKKPAKSQTKTKKAKTEKKVKKAKKEKKRSKSSKKTSSKNDTQDISDTLGVTEELTEQGKPASSKVYVPHYNVSEVTEIEHATTKFIEAYEKILELSPNMKSYQNSFNNKDKLDFQLIPSFTRYKLQLAAELKSQHELNKELNMTDVLSYESKYKSTSGDPVLPNLKQEDVERLTEDKPIDAAGNEESITSDKLLFKDVNQSTFISSNGVKKIWPPPLPPITDLSLRARVFTHKSMVTNKLYLKDSELLESHNERLEFLGDSVMNTLVTMFLYRNFPHYDEGQLSRLRVALVKNEKLKEFSHEYKMDQFIKSLVNQDENSNYINGKMKMNADIFEAYVGALVECGTDLGTIEKWLEDLCEPTVKAVTSMKRTQFENNNVNDVNAKKNLYSLIGYAALGLKYETIEQSKRGDPNFTVACKIADGTVLGVGRARNTKLAGLKAAENVLNNKELIEKYASQRAAIPRSESATKTNISVSSIPKQKAATVDNADLTTGAHKTPISSGPVPSIFKQARKEKKAKRTNALTAPDPSKNADKSIVLGPDGELQMI